MGDLATLPTFVDGTEYDASDFNTAFSNLTLANSAVTTNKLADNNVTLAKLQAIAQYQLFTRTTAGSGDPELITMSADVVALLQGADYAALKALLDLEIGTDVQAYNANLTTYAGIAPAAAIQAFLAAADNGAARTALGIASAYLEDIVTNVNQTGTGTGVALVFNTPGAPTLTLTVGKWLVIGTVAARMSDVAGACGFRFSDNAGANHFGAGVAPYLSTERSAVTVLGYKDVTSGTFDVFFHGQPVTGSTVNLGETTGISYAGHILAIKLEETG